MTTSSRARAGTDKNATPVAFRFKAKLRRPALPDDRAPWAFVLLPKEASNLLPRRGRTTIEGNLDGHAFQAMLEPDGQRSHWLRVDKALLEAAGATIGDEVMLEFHPVAQEPEPELPPDLHQALADAPEALAVWQDTTTIARVDWIHWIVSAKQARTRSQRIAKTCDMLAAGKRRVCCFDPSGFYSKAFAAPKEAV